MPVCPCATHDAPPVLTSCALHAGSTYPSSVGANVNGLAVGVTDGELVGYLVGAPVVGASVLSQHDRYAVVPACGQQDPVVKLSGGAAQRG